MSDPLFSSGFKAEGSCSIVSGGLEFVNFRIPPVVERGAPLLTSSSPIQFRLEKTPAVNAFAPLMIAGTLSVEGGKIPVMGFDLAIGEIIDGSYLLSIESFGSVASYATTTTLGVLETELSLTPVFFNELAEEIFDVLVTSSVGTGTALLRSESKALSLTDVALQVYALWGFQIQRLSQINIGLTAIVQWVNAAIQQIWSRAEWLDYFNRSTITVTVTSTGSLVLDTNIQHVLGYVRLQDGKKPLRAITSQSEAENFSARFLGGESHATPLAFWLQNTRQSEVDSVAKTLHLLPAPTGDTSVMLEVVMEPPRYDAIDFQRGVQLMIPHKWAETILLPMVKKQALGDPLMPSSSRDTLGTEINEQYRNAMSLLGLADPTPGAVTRSKPKEEQPAQ